MTELTENRKFCLYFHVNPVKKEVFYVGIGNKNRPYVTYGRNNHWNGVVKKYGFDVIIVDKNLSLPEAREQEQYFIELFGRHDLGLGPLVNQTIGGREGEGLDLEARKKIQEAHKGKTITDEHKRVLSKMRKGVPNKHHLGYCSEETKRKISEGNKGKVRTPEMRERLSKAMMGRKGHPHTEEFKKNMSKRLLGKKLKPLTEEHKEKIRQSLLGRKGKYKNIYE